MQHLVQMFCVSTSFSLHLWASVKADVTLPERLLNALSGEQVCNVTIPRKSEEEGALAFS